MISPPFVLPDERPPGLRTRRLRLPWYRIDANHPDLWEWEPFELPQHRFDPLSGRFRVRYAASTGRGAARERFPERRISAEDGALWLARLDGDLRLLDLCSEATLDRLRVDDRISTARLPRVRTSTTQDPFLDTCGRLTDLTRDWWRGDVPAIRFRSRTTPETSRNLVFCASADWADVSILRLRDCTDLLVSLALGDGFSFPSSWLSARR